MSGESEVTFECARCHHKFVKIVSEAELQREYERWFPAAHAAGEEKVKVCDPCWRFFTFGTAESDIFLA